MPVVVHIVIEGIKMINLVLNIFIRWRECVTNTENVLEFPPGAMFVSYIEI